VYDGETFDSGISFKYVTPSISLPQPLVTGNSGNTGSLVLGFSDGVYTDTSFPSGVSFSADGGNLVYVTNAGQTFVGTGSNVTTGIDVLPGMTLQVGYESSSANTVNSALGVFEYYAGVAGNVTLDGITYESATTFMNDGGPQYSFSGLSVMGTTDSVIVNRLYMDSSNVGLTFPVESADGYSTIFSGVTFDVLNPTLNYGSSPNTQSVPDFAIPLNGTLTVTVLQVAL
jgi:hypothetical protein